MTLVEVSLPPLDPEYVNQIYERARANETLFRNILTEVVADPIQRQFFQLTGCFFQTASLDDIFNNCVRVDGRQIARVGDFGVGPFASRTLPDHRFPYCDTSKLRENEALVLIERSNDSWIRTYKVLGDLPTALIGVKTYHQF